MSKLIDNIVSTKRKLSNKINKYFAEQNLKAIFFIKSFFKICFLVIFFNFVMILELILCSDASFSNFFIAGKATEYVKDYKNIDKIIVVDALGLDGCGGVSNVLENVVNGISKKRSNWLFLILCDADLKKPFKFENNNIKVVPLTYSFGKSLNFIRDVLSWLSFDLFHDQITQLLFYNDVIFDKNNCNLFFDACASYSYNDYYINKVSLVHDIMYFDMPESFNEVEVDWQKDNAIKIIKYSQKLITVSEFTKQRLIKAYHVDENFVEAIPLKLSKRIKSKKSAQDKIILQKFSLEPNQYLVFSSIYRKHKNHNRLVQAFGKFLQNNSNTNVKLAIIGAINTNCMDSIYKSLRDVCVDESQYQQLKQRIVITRYVSDEELNVLYSNAIAMIFPSLYEGFGMPVIEAMNAGIPVSCSKTASLPEVAGDAALFFDPYKVEDIEKAIKTMVDQKDLRKALIEKGFKRAEYYSDKDSMIDEYIKIFDECMN